MTRIGDPLGVVAKAPSLTAGCILARGKYLYVLQTIVSNPCVCLYEIYVRKTTL